MNRNAEAESPQPQQPHHHPEDLDENTNPFYQQHDPNPNGTATNPFLDHHHHQHEPNLYPPLSSPVPEQTISPAPATPAFPSSSSSSSAYSPPVEEEEKWGTRVMGTPAVPAVHPDNKKAAQWGAGAGASQESRYHRQPYLQYSPVEGHSGNGGGGGSSPMENIMHMFNSWSNKAESMASNIWHNLKTGPSVSGAAWGKVNLRAKTITGGGFETLYKQCFTTFPNETLRKTFACYLSTSTGPVAGTLYLSNIHAAFCSDRPLSFTAPSGQVTWCYYKVFVPLGRIGAVNPVVMREDQSEKYVQIVTLEGHDFWFMGFVNYEKACRHLTEGVSAFTASGVAVHPQPPSAAPHP